ncbi:MAG: methyltransferase domain-containing protein [Saprospiraceae bacterium]|nr:methyltransferase domain-containing protein [Candidatus Defluviibacterium haderslevense]MBK7244013.1 methyltransferase domain-containing protein [Candidatus Defluviibacterium haderslevense]MCC7027548.1 methyltransferase domain-containing protein [Saprospiraceae bacterium]
MNCRSCNTKVNHQILDLGFSPPSNSFLTLEQLSQPEIYFPLRMMFCEHCFLVQIDEFAKHEDIFNHEYHYFSSYSNSWLKHAKDYTEMMIQRFNLNGQHQVIEIASNDGYLLQYFKKKNIPVLGIEPTSNTAQISQNKGIETLVEFFGFKLAKDLVDKNIKADVLLGNNVLAHVPDINDFVSGMKLLLKKDGVITMEFPHLLQLVKNIQFDTIYHEHYSYLSCIAVQELFHRHDLELFDVEELDTHGGSLRIFVKHISDQTKKVSSFVTYILEKEQTYGLNNLKFYNNFQNKVDVVKNNFLDFLLKAAKEQKKVVAYGAAAKGNTFLNYCGVRKDLIQFIIDASPYKQNKFIPGAHIPVYSETLLKETKPDFILILPWNLKSEISTQLSYVGDWDCKFVVAVPELVIF